MLFALLLLLPPLVFTFQKFVEFVTFGERSHQLLARITENNLSISSGPLPVALLNAGEEADGFIEEMHPVPHLVVGIGADAEEVE